MVWADGREGRMMVGRGCGMVKERAFVARCDSVQSCGEGSGAISWSGRHCVSLCVVVCACFLSWCLFRSNRIKEIAVFVFLYMYSIACRKTFHVMQITYLINVTCPFLYCEV